ncbi:MAG: phosphoribosylaminoimidazole synthetase [Coxiella sp. DG_40]|nr:MAG: phosphoribosylaminoimidazole synthetase [Coxiella sp. DG_40]
MSKITYKTAGVDISAGNEVVRRIKDKVKSTCTSYILSDLNGFAALIDLKGILQKYKHPVLVQSIDGVGTKSIIARTMNRYDTLGIDLLSASCNDVLTVGATPVTLLDYIASDHLNPDIIDKLVSGMVTACRENDISLVGGETAEMPNIYLPNEHDLVGIVTGIVEKDKIVTGKEIQCGDKVLGFMSSGLHTNGYSLARKLFFDVAKLTVASKLPELEKPLGEILLTAHLNYTKPVLNILDNNIPIKGMAHITGGGLLENVPRILPNNCAVKVNKNSWQIPAIFKVIQTIGKLNEPEIYRTFNMGIGFVLIVAQENVNAIMQKVKTYSDFKLLEIGEVISGHREVVLAET